MRSINTIPDFAGYTASGLDLWQRSVRGIEDIRITSTADGAQQPVLWLPPGGQGSRPLLVILHSWSADYLQHGGIPYAMWAQENGWAVVVPNFRGTNDTDQSSGSDLAVGDVVDAIDYAVAHGGVDAGRVYTVGWSSGGMMSLLMAGRHPDKITAAAAWGAPHDLVQFYRESSAADRHYAQDIENACGGDPTQSGPARDECLHRSPMTHLDAARDYGVPVFIGQGLSDSILSPAHGVSIFNQLADPADRFRADQVIQFAEGSIPEGIVEPIATDSYFGEGDPTPLFARHSAAVWLVLFQGDHNMVYEATVRWFAGAPEGTIR